MAMETNHLLCPKYEKAVHLFGKRWTGLILRVLQHSPLRFTQLKEAIPHISSKVLTERLKELEQEDIIALNQSLYSLTQKGIEMGKALDEIQAWADKFA